MVKNDYRPAIIDDMLKLLPSFGGTVRISTMARCWNWSSRTLRYYVESGQLEAIPMPGKKRRVGHYTTTKPAVERFLVELTKSDEVGKRLIEKALK